MLLNPENPVISAILSSAESTSLAQQGDYGDCAAFLNKKTLTSTDSTRRIMDDFIDVLGAWNTNVVLESLQVAASGKIDAIPAQLAAGTLRQVNGDGVDMSRPGVQSMLVVLATAPGYSWEPGLLEAVQEMGVRQESVSDRIVGRDVTAEECESVWTTHQLSQRVVNAVALAEQRLPGQPAEGETQDAADQRVWNEVWQEAI